MNIQQSRKHELEQKINDLELSLSELKFQFKLQEEKEQHEAIDNLGFYLDQVDNKYENLRIFRSIIAEELREFFNKSLRNDSAHRN